MANVVTGRQIIINTSGLINIPCNIKVIDCWWQDIAAASDTFTLVDAAGRTYTFTTYSAGGTGFPPLSIGKLDWLEGPITVTIADNTGNVYMILGNK